MTAFEIFNSDYSNSLSLLLSYGWALKSETEKEIRLTRPCKNIRDGLSGILNKQTAIFTNFSSSVDLPVKSNTIGYNFYELLRHYQFNGDTQATNQYIFDKYKNNNIDLPKRNFHHVIKKQIPDRPVLYYSKKFYYKFADYELEERAAIYQYDCNKTRYDAEQLVIKEFPNCIRERAYRVAINRQVINKNCNQQGLPHPNGYVLTNKFENNFLTLDEIGTAVTKGYTQCYCNFLENEKGEIHKCSESFINCDLIAIDIDGGLSIDEFLSKQRKGAVGLYTSYNHTEKLNKFRILFQLPVVIEKQTDFKQIITKFINEYKSDPACKDPARAFYGATNGFFINLVNGNIIFGKECKLWK